MRGDEIDVGRVLRKITPNVPDFTCCPRYIGLFFNALDESNQIIDVLLTAIARPVPDAAPDAVAGGFGTARRSGLLGAGRVGGVCRGVGGRGGVFVVGDVCGMGNELGSSEK